MLIKCLCVKEIESLSLQQQQLLTNSEIITIPRVVSHVYFLFIMTQTDTNLISHPSSPSKTKFEESKRNLRMEANEVINKTTATINHAINATNRTRIFTTPRVVELSMKSKFTRIHLKYNNVEYCDLLHDQHSPINDRKRHK